MANNALTITQQYPAERYNLLVPMQTVTEIADIQRPVMNAVTISTNLRDGEIYEMEKAKDGYTGNNGRTYDPVPAKYALTKKGLTKLMRAAGIKILDSEACIPSTCQKCREVNRGIGKPVCCGNCQNKDVKHKVRISVPQLTGENLTIVAHKEIVVSDVTDGMADRQRKEFMKFRSEMCESKALNRALRTAMQIKSYYSLDELKKPFVVAYLVPNLDNPDVKKKAVDSMFDAANDLYGGRPSSQHTLYVDDDGDDELDGAQPIEADYRQQADEPAEPDEQLPPQEPYQYTTPAPAPSPAPARQQQSTSGGRCADCGKEVGDDVSKYSQQHFGAIYCRACQKQHQWRR